MKCPECGSEKVVKAGAIITRRGSEQRLQCRGCGRMFNGGKKK